MRKLETISSFRAAWLRQAFWRIRTLIGGLGLAGLGAGCGSDAAEGRLDAVVERDGLDAADTSDASSATDTAILPDSDVAPDAGDDVGVDIGEDVADDVAADVGPEIGDDVGDDVAEDVAAEVAEDVAAEVAEDVAAEVAEDVAADTTIDDTSVGPTCGNGVLEADEACDDGDDCAGDGCTECAYDPALVLVELALDGALGWDLDDLDQDGDATTGIDNLLGRSDTVRLALNGLLANQLSNGALVQVATLGDVDQLTGDDAVTVSLFRGADPGCGAVTPPPWLDAGGPIYGLWRSPDAFTSCVARASVTDADDPANGILATVVAGSPAPPWLRAWAAQIDLPIGALGTLAIARARLEGHLDLVADALRGMSGGRLGGVVPAATLARIDTSSLTPLCPTALQAVLGLAGHIDQDAEGNGTRDFIQWTTTAGPGLPCITKPVTIVGCCDDGDCANAIPGADCVTDARIGDGFSAAFRIRANAVQVLAPEPVDACLP